MLSTQLGGTEAQIVQQGIQAPLVSGMPGTVVITLHGFFYLIFTILGSKYYCHLNLRTRKQVKKRL